MNLSAAIDAYLTLKRSLGAVFAAETRILRSFGKGLGDVSLDAIRPDACDLFCRGTATPTRWWERKYYALREFFRFLVARGHLGASPLPEARPQVQRCFVPYIYSHPELQRLLDATAIFSTTRLELQPATLRALLLTLYAAGLRPSEGLRLRCCDVDLRAGVLAIWDTKFFKSRLVPIGMDLTRALEGYYRAQRRQLAMPDGGRSVFFASPRGQAIPLRRLEYAFTRLRQHVGIGRPPGMRGQPRLHDLRHTFAVHRLIAWYGADADVQTCLPFLATYLGHVNLTGTQAYLTMTPELLAVASQRFAQYARLGGVR
jgi:site-specific recombinase XerD